MFIALKFLGKQEVRSRNFNSTTLQLRPYASHGATMIDDDESAVIFKLHTLNVQKIVTGSLKSIVWQIPDHVVENCVT